MANWNVPGLYSVKEVTALVFTLFPTLQLDERNGKCYGNVAELSKPKCFVYWVQVFISREAVFLRQLVSLMPLPLAQWHLTVSSVKHAHCWYCSDFTHSDLGNMNFGESLILNRELTLLGIVYIGKADSLVLYSTVKSWSGVRTPSCYVTQLRISPFQARLNPNCAGTSFPFHAGS